jgi:FkbM family methyltransferase
MYDIGANVGFFTVLAARRGGEVHAFEPDPANFKLLERHLSLNALTGATAYEMAVSDRDGTAHFRPDGSMGHLAEAGIPVRTARLDTLMASGVATPAVIKVDVEGAELEVLHGGSRLLSTHRPVLIISLHGVVGKGIDVDTECLKLLRSLGYTCSRMRHGDWVCLPDPHLANKG